MAASVASSARAALSSNCALEEEAAVRTTTFLLAGLTLLDPSPARAQRLEAGAFVTYAFLEEIGSSDHGAGTSTLGLGGRAVWHLVPFVDLDGELAVHPNAGVSGYKVQGFLGAKSGVRVGRLGAFAKIRPGFLFFSKDPFGVGRPGAPFPHTDWAHSIDPAFDVGGVVEYYAPSGMIVRFDLGDTIVRYHARSVVSQLQPPRQVAGFTSRNRQWSLGLAKRF
jgi:hypothetical protein